MTDSDSPSYKVRVDGMYWEVNSEFAEYDATHTVAGALLGGADSVEIERIEE